MLLECENERTADEEEMVSGWIFVNVKGHLPAQRERERGKIIKIIKTKTK